jgi:hypothetical protein
MDHIIENEGNPVPDLDSVTTSSGSRAQPMDVDDDDDGDAEALRALTGKANVAPSGADVEAKVCIRSILVVWNYIRFASEYQMRRVW